MPFNVNVEPQFFLERSSDELLAMWRVAFLESQVAVEDATAKMDTPAKRNAPKKNKKHNDAGKYAEFAERAGPPRA